MVGRRKKSYSAEYPRQMYLFFTTYSEAGAPSFCKFASRIGCTTEELLGFRVHREFDRAYRECSEIRRDYLIDNALTRRFDPSLVKYLLSLDEGDADSEDQKLDFRLEVIEG